MKKILSVVTIGLVFIVIDLLIAWGISNLLLWIFSDGIISQVISYVVWGVAIIYAISQVFWIFKKIKEPIDN